MTETIVQDGTPVLRAQARPLTEKDIRSAKTARLIARMKELLAQESNGVGLAAPQVGESVRLFIVSGRAFLSAEPKAPSGASEEGAREDGEPSVPPDRVFINPEIIRQSRKKVEMSEGCLSVRGYYGTVMRSEKATVRAQDENGKTFTYHGSGLIAHIFQHEVDHLNGVLYVDKTVKLEKEPKREELRKQRHPGEKKKPRGAGGRTKK